jgi:anti-anti-sigma regulatory factor
MVEEQRQGVSIEGRVNIDTSGDMRRTIAEALRSKPPAVMLDLSGVSYLDT